VDRGWERPAAALLVLAAAALHFAYLLKCPLDLAPDEAHYWDWSRHLDWSYYSKGPLVAWIIRLSCELFGGWSERLIGSPMIAIRLPAILFGSLSLAATYVLIRRISQSERVALGGVAALLTMPLTAAGSTLMTIDSPFICLWGWSLVFADDAIFQNKRWAWPTMGLFVGLGILAKYTMVLWVVGLLAFLATTTYRREFLKPGLWLAGLMAVLCCIPIIIWNAQHDWITLRHVGTQAGAGVSQIRWFGPFRFLGEQMGLLLIVWFVPFVGAMWANRPGRGAPSLRQLLWWSALVPFATFLTASFKSPGQVNWPIAAYVGGFVLACDWLALRIHEPIWRRNIAGAAIVGLGLSFVLHFPATIRTPLATLADWSERQNPCPIRKFDPTVRLRGWRHLAREVDRLRVELAAAGETPVIATTFWNIAGELAFYCDGHPNVYCLGPAVAQRMSQYDLWRPNPLWDPETFADRTFILVGDPAPELAAGFAQMDFTRKFWYREAGQPICYWHINVGRGYRGYGPPNRWPGHLKY
jgi:4-amino-4-deoxy-L-arabinose transferase-like glycosyltransferase